MKLGVKNTLYHFSQMKAVLSSIILALYLKILKVAINSYTPEKVPNENLYHPIEQLHDLVYRELVAPWFNLN